MPIQVLMPALSPTMTEGTVANWIKSEGDEVSSGDVLCEIETDKATMEIEAIDDGVLGKIIVAGGTKDVAVNSIIGLILEDGEKMSDLDLIDSDLQMTSSKSQSASENNIQSPADTVPVPVAPQENNITPNISERTFASPLARRIAERNEMDVSLIKGSGPRGRVVKRDVEEALRSQTSKPASNDPVQLEEAYPAVANFTAKDPQLAFMPTFTATPHSSMRKVIAQRLTDSARDVPHFNINLDVEIDELLSVRNQLNSRDEPDYNVSINDMIIKSVAIALELQTDCNVAFTEDGTLRFNRVDVAMAVAVEGGLLTPVIKDAAGRGLRAISRETIELAQKARDGKLQPEEYQGGTFTVSNLGMYGVKSFNSIINTPHGGILSVGAGEQRPVVKNGALAVATVMSLTLAFDHRCIDGVAAAAFTRELKDILETPVKLML